MTGPTRSVESETLTLNGGASDTAFGNNCKDGWHKGVQGGTITVQLNKRHSHADTDVR